MKTKILGLLAVGLLAGPTAQAAVITVYFQSTIDQITSDPAGVFPANGIAVGSVLEGFYAYDDTATNIDCCGVNFDEWNLVGFSINLPGAISPVSISAADFGGSGDRYASAALYQFSPSTSGFIRLDALGDFGYGSEVGIGTGHLIKPPPVLDTPLSSGGAIGYRISNQFHLALITTTFSLTPFTSVPEPGTLALLGLGLVGLGVMRRRAA